jgi:hypothetical protein
MGNVEKDAIMLDSTFDPIAVVADWLDSCRSQSLDNLLDLHDTRGSLERACGRPCP